MKINSIDASKTVEQARALLESEKKLYPSTKAVFGVLLTLVEILLARLLKNSKNSSIPPSQDLNREKEPKKSALKPGGQKNHIGKTLTQTKKPDEIIDLNVDLKDLPEGQYKNDGYEARQVVNFIINKKVTEYRAYRVVGSNGVKYKASFPKGVTSPIQYGDSVKAHALYLSMFQLIPYERLQDYFTHQLDIPLSTGTLCNFNKEGFLLLEDFERFVKKKLEDSEVVQVDETGVNINGKLHWLHTTSNERWSLFYPHAKRGADALHEINILPNFKGIAVHDHWSAYYHYNQFKHALCNAHHIRELTHAAETKKCLWASVMIDLLLEMKTAKEASLNKPLTDQEILEFKGRYRQILKEGEAETPPPKADPLKKGRTKKEKERNLLERLQNFEDDVLRFLTSPIVPFTNNLAENDLRMTKVQQKISGCFKNIEGAKTFCRIRSYILTSQKHGISPADALKQLFFNHSYPEQFHL